MARTIEELKLGFDRIEAAQHCRNLMGRYSYLHTASRNNEYVELWSKRDDCLLVMPFGIYRGFENVRKCYVDIHGDRSEVKTLDFLRGGVFMHEMDTEIIEVAEDGQTAKGCWISQGHETYVDRFPGGDGKPHAEWCWGKYEVDFIKDEDGSWKFWHMILYPLFLTPYDRSWGEPPPEMVGAEETPGIDFAKPLDKPFWEYGPDVIYPENEPAIPWAYDSYPGI